MDAVLIHALHVAVEIGEGSNRRFQFSHLWPFYLDALSVAPESQTPPDRLRRGRKSALSPFPLT